jgi:hypothetical protein
MSTDATLRSRRALLGAAAAAVATTAATAVGGPWPARAAEGDPLILGQANAAFDPTRLEGILGISNSESVGPTLRADDVSADGYGAIKAMSTNHTAITAGNVSGEAAIYGVAHNRSSEGIHAANTAGGTGLAVYGKVNLLTRSGRATIPAGRDFVDIDLRGTQKGGLSGTPLCFANLTSHRPGVHVEAVRPNDPIAGKVRIYLNRAVNATTFVAWFVLN